jgi:hypothetical protein
MNINKLFSYDKTPLIFDIKYKVIYCCLWIVAFGFFAICIVGRLINETPIVVIFGVLTLISLLMKDIIVMNNLSKQLKSKNEQK